MKLINMYFRHKTHCCLLHLSTVESISPLCSWAILTKDHQPKAPKCETSVLFSTSSLHFGLPATNGVWFFHIHADIYFISYDFFFFIIAILTGVTLIYIYLMISDTEHKNMVLMDCEKETCLQPESKTRRLNITFFHLC